MLSFRFQACSECVPSNDCDRDHSANVRKRFGSVYEYSTMIAPALRTAHGNHSFGRQTRVDPDGAPEGSMKFAAVVSFAPYNVALSIKRHSKPKITAMMPIPINRERHM